MSTAVITSGAGRWRGAFRRLRVRVSSTSTGASSPVSARDGKRLRAVGAALTEQRWIGSGRAAPDAAFRQQSSRVRRDCQRATGGTSGSMDKPTAEHTLRQLEPLVGEWTFEAKWPSGEPWRAAEGSPSSGTPRGHTCSSVGRPSFPRRPTTSPSSDAMRPTGRTSSCTPTSAASVVSTR